MGAKAPDLASLKKMFEDSTNLTTDARKEARIDQDPTISA